MAKWNPFGDKVLNVDSNEFAGENEAGYGIPHDADHIADRPEPENVEAGTGTGFPEPGSEGMPGSGADLSGPDGGAGDMGAGTGTGIPELRNESMSGFGPDGGAGDMEPGAPEPERGETGMGTGFPEPGSESMSQSGAQIPEPGSESMSGPGAQIPEPGSDSTSQSGAQIPGPDGGAGNMGAGIPEPEAGSGNMHDFEVDEPKFDTQTGEPLDKPKKKLPAMILTAVVSVLAVCAFFYSVKPGSLPSRKDSAQKEPVETETHLAIAASESETETESAAPSEAGTQTQNAAPSEAGIQTQNAAGASETETDKAAQILAESQTQIAALLSAASQTEALTEEEAAAPSREEILSHAGTETETELETESETETTSEADDRIPQFKTEGVMVSVSLDVADLVEEAMPGVVSVTATSVQTVRDFFYGQQEIRQTDAGSGIIVDRDDNYLYIVTDAGIVGDAQDVTVGFSIGKDSAEDLTYEDTVASAEVMGIDEDSLLAVIRVPADGIHEKVQSMIRPAVLGDSDAVRVGEGVFAIGNAMGRGLSVTQGIISALDRPMRYGSSVHNFIQTDASINYGNYGGALLNEAGEVIGINAGKITENASEGMGFAFPVNDAKEVISSMIGSGGSASSQDAGKESGQEKKEQEKEQKETLALALATEESEPLQETPAPQTEGAKETTPSQTEGAEETIPPQTDEAKETTPSQTEGVQESGMSEETAPSGNGGQLGVQVGEFSKEDQIIYRIPAGVAIADVVSGSGAQMAGLAAGDLITGINDEQVGSVEELKDALSNLKAGDRVKVSFIRPDENSVYDEDNVTSVMVTLQ